MPALLLFHQLVYLQKAFQYTGGAIALAYLWSLDDANFKMIIVDYYKIYAEQNNLDPGNG